MEEARRAAYLAKITLSEAEEKRAEEDIKKMLGFFEVLKSADVSGVSEEKTGSGAEREDKVREDEDSSNAVMANAQKLHENMFVVPRTFG